MSTLDRFIRQHDFLVCVDLDGCALDTMNLKHFHCYGPCVVMEWELEQWRVKILERWNEWNLFCATRGSNRFLALTMILEEIDRQYATIIGLDALQAWTRNAKPLTEENLSATIATMPEGDGKTCLCKALSWSQAVNASIHQLPMDLKLPFEGVPEALEDTREFADVVLIGDPEEGYRLHDHVLRPENDLVSECLAHMLQMGYPRDHVLMVGDTLADKKAAEENGVRFFPILVRQEVQCWQEYRQEALGFFRSLDYSAYEIERNRQFLKHLGEKVP